MNLRTRVINAVTAFSGEEKATNSIRDDENNFLRFGNRSRPIYQDWSQVEMSDEDMYTGYSYAAIKKRANRASALGKRFLYTEASASVMDAAKKADNELEHPYLELIRKSKDFTTRKFWHDISTYLDLEGVYYLLAVRAIGQNQDGTVKVGEVQGFEMMNPYNIRRVIRESDGTLGAYVEAKNGLYREIPKEMVIEIRLLNPFNNDEAYSMTDAAKESQFTMKQASDYTRHSIKGNTNAPGIISTDVILDDPVFDNFVSHIKNHGKGEPLYSNGSGGVHWETMQIDLDKAALDKINEINRQVLFAVSGTSKTTLGIEESGTTRDTSQVQKDNFTEDSVMPQIEDIIDALNLDYRRYYPEWEKNEYEIMLDNPLETNRDAELADIEIRDAELNLRESLIEKGYEYEIAAKYAHGDIGLDELGEPTLEPELTPDLADAMAAKELGMPPPQVADPNNPQAPNSPAAPKVAPQSRISAANKFVKPQENEKALKEARKRMAAKKKELDKEAKDGDSPQEQSETIIQGEEDKKKVDKKTTTVTVKLQNEVEEKATNQIAAHDMPDLYNGLEIDPRAVTDNDYRGCIMVDTELIPVTQYVKNGQADLLEAERPEDHEMGAVSEKEPHATLLFGLLNNGNVWKDKVNQVLTGWSMDTVKIAEVSYLDTPDSYAVIGLLEVTPEIVDGHERLTLLPHVNTFSEYHPHITLAYISKEADVDKWVKSLGKKYNGQIVATKGINYGDQPDAIAENHVEDEHDMSNLPKVTQEEAAEAIETAKKKDSTRVEDEEPSTNALEVPHSHDCIEHGLVSNSTLERARNALEPGIREDVILQEASLQNAVAQLEAEIQRVALQSLQQGETEEIVPPQEEDGFVVQLAAILAAYYTILFPIYAAQLFSARLAQFYQQGIFAMTDTIENYIRVSAQNAAESHVRTVIADFMKAYNAAADDVTRKELINAVMDKVQAQDSEYLKKLPENPNREDVTKAVDAGKFDKDPAYNFAREKIREGAGLAEVQRAIQSKFSDISKTRAKTIARHEASRVFNMSQYEADLQFLTETNNLKNAYKRLRSRTNDPCAVCSMIIAKTRANPIPFKQNFADLGSELTASYRKDNGKLAVQKVLINYEAIKAGNVHVHCNCEYELVIKNDDGTVLNDLRLSGAYNKFDPTQPRDKDGKWSDIGGGVDAFDGISEDAIDAFIHTQGLNATDEQKKSLEFYCGPGSSYDSINRQLRKTYADADMGQVVTNESHEKSTIGEVVQNMDAMIGSNSNKKQITSYRQSSIPKALASKLTEGTGFTDDGYVSTTMDFAHARTFQPDDSQGMRTVFSTITIPQGTPGIFPSNGMTDNLEQEFILKRGTSFKVKSRQEYDDIVLLELEVA